MRLKTKLVLSATGLTFTIVLALSALFLGELLKQRIGQMTQDNQVLAHEVYLMARQAILQGQPPRDHRDETLQASVLDALRKHAPLTDTMNAIIRYAPTVQDVSITDSHGITLVSTDPDALDQLAPSRVSLEKVRDSSLFHQWHEMFGKPHVLDISLPLDRNGMPFVVVHLGVQSSFLRATYKPLLMTGISVAVGAALVAMLAAALLASAVLQPINQISEQLEMLTQTGVEEVSQIPSVVPRRDGDAVVRVTRTIDKLGRRIRSTEAEYTALQANLNQMLDTLREGVLLFTADRRAVMVSDAVAHLLDRRDEVLVGMLLEEIFDLDSPLGAAALTAFVSDSKMTSETVMLEDGRRIQLSMNRIENGNGRGEAGALLTLRDIESAQKLEQELEVSRRLVAIGRLTAGVGHEVKNPINAMVLHLELLRSKLAGDNGFAASGAQRHVDILAGEMQRLDRVVQTLADFTRPMELHLREYDLRKVIAAVVELTATEMSENNVRVEPQLAARPIMVWVDADLIRQALLNLLLNAMQAMPRGGLVQIALRREGQNAVVDVIDEGEGIPPELLPRIFDLYFTTKTTGSGIGLAMTYRILQMHGGALEVRSRTDPHLESVPAGTAFTLRLPLMPTRGSDQGIAERAGVVEREQV